MSVGFGGASPTAKREHSQSAEQRCQRARLRNRDDFTGGQDFCRRKNNVLTARET
jgi:hypothetical protein